MATKKNSAKKAQKSASKTVIKTASRGSIKEFDGSPINTDATILSVMPQGRDIVVVSVNEYKGNSRLDVRTFWLNDSEEWMPGKGIGIRKDAVATFIDTLASNVERIAKLLG